MTNEEAKKMGATHYRYTMFGIPCYFNCCTDGFYYWSVLKQKLIKSFSSYHDLKPL